jgi:hypothetical protein
MSIMEASLKEVIHGQQSQRPVGNFHIVRG